MELVAKHSPPSLRSKCSYWGKSRQGVMTRCFDQVKIPAIRRLSIS